MTEDKTTIFNAMDAAEEPQVKALRERLIEQVRRAVNSGAPVDQIPGLHLSYVEQPQTVANCFYVLSVGLILQGTKKPCDRRQELPLRHRIDDRYIG